MNEMAQLKSKLVEFTDDELALVTGGLGLGAPSISDLPEYYPANLTRQ